MLNSRSTFILSLKNRNGQVALFVALIFQILFLFFAMVINVGLLVHHKINLQNSVDLAAYYGAMKQADNMNAVAHINYQIRQSWKLLAWRYRVIGSAGDFVEHPLEKRNKQLTVRSGSQDSDDINPGAKDFYDAPAFCITYMPFAPTPVGENTCKDITKDSGVRLFNAPQIYAPFQTFSIQIKNATELFKSRALERCRDFGAINYETLAKFVVAYNIDQADRMALITAISRTMSNSQEDFLDLNGDSVREGIEKTLKNNLTSANLDGLVKSSLKVYNSLGNANCNNPSDATSPAKWLMPIKIAPAFNYTDTQCISGNLAEVKTIGRELAADQANWPIEVRGNPTHRYFNNIKDLAPYVGMTSNLSDPHNYSLGVEKNPWCMAYVGVSAESKPSIPFSPFGPVTLKARAFFKPFGGRIGPWYTKTWSQGSDKSDGTEKTDANVPPRISDVSNIGTPKDPTRVVNYSRFVGDEFGMKSRNVLFQFGRAIFKLNPDWDYSSGAVGSAPSGNTVVNYDKAPTTDHWRDLPMEFAKKNSPTQDMLAWSSDTDKPSRFRYLEIAAIVPDQFDMAYYSIEPDFYNNYYLRIKDKFISHVPAFNQGIRPDIGYHKGYNEGWGIKSQIDTLKNSTEQDLNLEFNSKLTYLSEKWANVLTGWTHDDLLDYSLSQKKFGKCLMEPKMVNGKPSPPTTGNCVVGGSTGYSVKMVSIDYLKDKELKLGGKGTGGGAIKNPPPSDF